MLYYGINGGLDKGFSIGQISESFAQARGYKYSDLCPVLSVVPQGTVLAPLLFLLYINDISNNIRCTLYADDILIFINSVDDYNCLITA